MAETGELNAADLGKRQIGNIDIVPRGGKGLIARLMAEATVPMIKHLDGICHVYLDAKADPARPSLTSSASERLQWIASEPPRRMVALPLLMHRPAASIVTFGRAS